MFDWDDANVDHIARHGVTPEEAEEAVLDGHRVVAGHRVVEQEPRRSIVGSTTAGRLIVVVITVRQGLVRVVTAHEPSPGQARLYRRRLRK